VIESNEINAFGLPGGYLYVDSGLILAADSEAELAGVVAHEVAHVAARHDARIATRNRIWKLISYCSGPAGGAVKLAGYIWSTKLRRGAEREADFLGLEYQYASGYDPRAFVQFFERLHIAEDHSFIGKMFARYPLTEDRIRRRNWHSEKKSIQPGVVHWHIDILARESRPRAPPPRRSFVDQM
jgi:predicted Zn-dependent protease